MGGAPAGAATTNGSGSGAGAERGGAKGENSRREKKGWSLGGGGCRSEGSQAVEQVKAKTSDDSPMRMLSKADLANQSLILISSLDGATFLLFSECPAHHHWHGFAFLHNLYHVLPSLILCCSSFKQLIWKARFWTEKKRFRRYFTLRTLSANNGEQVGSSVSPHIWRLSPCSSIISNKASVRGR